MIHDAKVEVTCDGHNCCESIAIELPFVYPSYSGRNGRYDHDPEGVNKRVRKEGWTVIESEDGDEDHAKHFCEGCAPEEEAEE